ncbi:cytochrome P460 [Paraburkholderia ginsengiterrae]|uniref:Cytochrome P460 n=1 Tax=Paraburkholderia ginsengiterrae TaxID=1462993 RepID=A0ABX2UXJ8_9BURK|nr:VTT domain-containing protein [Paraburkholderia ginsengiterrae]OAJ59877.1 cytochrome P460 [Paraburkholderia ginsengiterrae]
MIVFPSSAVSAWGSAFVFVNVLLTRLGVPIPAVPVLLFAGSAIASGTLPFWPTLGAAAAGALIGDGTWFTAGRLYGRKLIAAFGRLSPAIDSKVDKARALFERFGVPLVSISKFVPGLGLITPPLMGATAVDVRIYAVWDLAGVLAWATFWLLGGAAAERELHMLLDFVRARGGTVIDILAAATLVYLVFRLQQRRRDRRRLADATRAEAARTTALGWPRLAPPKVLDARPQAPVFEAPHRIPGALTLNPDSPEQIDGALRAHDTVIYCVCPDSATAVEMTQHMREHGYTRIRALRGGLDAWQRRGFPVEPPTPAGEPASGHAARESRDEARGAITLRGVAPRGDQGT